jgi:predicted alpha/beta-hydrolase family hydrolase
MPGSILIFTHGAGGTLSAPAVQNFCEGYSEDATVLAFQGSMNLKSRVNSFKFCVQWLEDEQAEARKQGLVLGGRSMGARAAVMCASEVLEESSEGEIRLVLISYPLVGPKQDLRDQILLDLPKEVRVLFVIGDRDSMCPLDVLEGVRSKMKAPNGLVVVRGADHGMHVRGGKDGERRMGEETGRVASQWIGGKDIVGEDIVYIGDERQDKEE